MGSAGEMYIRNEIDDKPYVESHRDHIREDRAISMVSLVVRKCRAGLAAVVARLAASAAAMEARKANS